MSSPHIAACPPGVPFLRKRSPEGDRQDNPPTRTVAGYALTESERIVGAMNVSSYAPVVCGEAVAAGRSPITCAGTVSCVECLLQ